MVKNTMKAIKAYRKTANIRYQIHSGNINDIHNGYADEISKIVAGFEFGFVQGRKAALAEMRKGGAAV